MMPLLLEHILHESPASIEAKKAHLVHVGYGNWAKEKGGDAIAHTDKKTGKLVYGKAAPKGGATKKAAPDKPTRTRAKRDATGRARGKADAPRARAKKKAPVKTDTRGLKAVQQLYKESKRALVGALKRDGVYSPGNDFMYMAMYALTSPDTEPAQLVKNLTGNDASPETTQRIVDYINKVREQPPLTGVQKVEMSASFGDEDSKDALKEIKKLQAGGLKVKMYLMITGKAEAIKRRI